MDLTRFRGHLNLTMRGVHDAKNKKALPAGVPGADGRAGTRGPQPGGASREFEPSAQSIINWAAQADRDEGKRKDGLTNIERDELSRLRKENRQLKLEREILSKAAAWFAQETVPNSKRSSNS